jgi:hypothetical protein
MHNRVENEVDKTLGLIKNMDIHISPDFSKKMSIRLEKVRIAEPGLYRSRAFYPVAVLILIIFNLAGGFTLIAYSKSQHMNTNYEISVLANDYGIGQQNRI